MTEAYQSADPVASVTAIYRDLGLDTEIQTMIDAECEAACAALDGASLEAEHKAWLVKLAHSLSTRTK